MKHLLSNIAALILFSLSSGSFANQAENHRIEPGKVLGFVMGDWNDDGGMDRAVLAAPDNEDHDVGLYIYLLDDANHSQLEIFKPNLVWSGAMWGNMPSLALNAAGSLQILSQNQAIGRHRWSQKLTIAYRKNHFVVAGYTYDSYDTLDPNSGLSCDINLLTGKGVKNKKPFKIAKGNNKLADWSNDSIPKACQED